MVNDHDYNELKRLLRNNTSNQQREELLKRLDAPAYQYRIKRLENMQSQLDNLMKEVYNIEKDKSTDSISTVLLMLITKMFITYNKE